MNKHQQEWEDAAKLNEDRFIATGWHYSSKLYECSGILSTGQFIEELQNHLDRKEFDKKDILEIGCGNGRMTKYLAKCFNNVTAVDCSSTMVEKGKKLVDDVNVIWGVTENDIVPALDDVFDIVFSFIVFQHCKEQTVKTYLKEANRLLKSGGLFVFQLPVADEHKEPDKFNAVANWTVEEITKELPNFELVKLGKDRLTYHVFKKK